jgi:hypothetical protein
MVTASSWRRGVVAAVAAAAFGCGSGETRHALTGTVTFAGKPVEYGTIAFEPDASVAGFAPSCYAKIADGVYTTGRADGPTTGRYNVRVLGFDKARVKRNPETNEASYPDLFPPYTTTVEIPPPGGRLDIDVPASASRPK